MMNSEAEYNQMLSDNNEYQYNNQREITVKHTPGPWIVAEDQVGDDDGNVIADVTLYNEWNTTEGIVTKEMPWEANARLIAAAPEMLELLEALVSYDSLASTRAKRKAYQLIQELKTAQ